MRRAGRPPPGPGPSLASGDAYQYQLRHIKQNLDPGDALAAERAISSLATNAEDAWSLLAVCAVSAPLPHSVEVVSGNAFSAWLMQPEQKHHPLAGRRASSSGGAPVAAGAPGARSRSLPGRRALAQAHPPGTVSLPDVTVLDPKKVPRRPGRLAAAKAQQPPHSPRQPQPPQQPWVLTPESLPPQSHYLPPPPAAVSERPTAMSRLDLPTGLVTEQAASPRLLPPGKRMLPVGGGKEAAAGGTEAAGGVDAAGNKEERAAASTPRDAALPEQEAVAVAECPHCHRTFLEARLAKHAPICQQAQARKKATPSKGGDGGKAEAGKADKIATPAEEKKNLKWRNESANLRAAMEYNRKLAQAEKAGVDISTLPPPPAQADDDRVECPHCNRKFQADVAERHIPKCNAKGYPKRKPPPPPPPPPPPAATTTVA